MTDNMKRLLDRVSADSALAERASRLGKAELIALARELGLELGEADFVSNANADLSDDEMAAVAGGGTCACVASGGGTADDKCRVCACVIVGHGDFIDYYPRCACALGGGGVGE